MCPTVSQMKLLPREDTSGKNVPMLLLLAACFIEFLFIILERQFSNVSYYLTEDYLIVPCLLFLGYVLRENPSRFATKPFLWALAAVSWFLIVQVVHKLSGMDNQPIGTIFFVHLMAFPFAVLADDRDNTGMRIVGGMFVAACMVLVFYGLLLLLDLVPAWMAEYLYWDGARLQILWHPNIVASYLMIGIGFAMAFCAHAQKKLTKGLLIGAIILQLIAMALTNCRTTILLTGALLGGTLFFLIFKGGWKRFLLGLLAAAIVLAGSFKLSGVIYRWNNDRLIAAYFAAEEANLPEEVAAQPVEDIPQAETEQPVEEIPQAETEQPQQEVSLTETAVTEETIYVREDTGILGGYNGQGTLLMDLWSFNGRTYYWSAALSAIRDSKSIQLWGTEYAGTAIAAYLGYDPYHAHNSWIETCLRTGVPGLVIYLVFTVLSIWRAAQLMLSGKTELWKKIIAMTTMCVMASGFLESYLFIANLYYHVPGFVCFFLTGYLDYWCRKPVKQET